MTKRLACLSLIGMLAIAAWFAGFSAFVQSAVTLAPPQEVVQRDAIVVLTGGTNRVDTGFDLLEKGFGKKLFISGVYRGNEAKQLLKHWKNEPQSNLDCCVVLGFEADNTAGNAKETVDWLRRENFRTVYLVTANYHIKRAMLEFSALAPDLDIIPYPVVPDKIDLNDWKSDTATRHLLMREYAKYIAMMVLHSLHLQEAA